MRINISYKVTGSHIDEIVKKATTEWKEMSGQASLPEGAEIDIKDSENSADNYTATIYIKTKQETNG
ncbi:hypothetical protein [Actinomycetia phage DSL-LC01]|nr:hypothetical protein [Actinomycetia phage DSL-LC01]